MKERKSERDKQTSRPRERGKWLYAYFPFFFMAGFHDTVHSATLCYSVLNTDSIQDKALEMAGFKPSFR